LYCEIGFKDLEKVLNLAKIEFGKKKKVWNSKFNHFIKFCSSLLMTVLLMFLHCVP